jgi:hypothetical protein
VTDTGSSIESVRDGRGRADCLEGEGAWDVDADCAVDCDVDVDVDADAVVA